MANEAPPRSSLWLEQLGSATTVRASAKQVDFLSMVRGICTTRSARFRRRPLVSVKKLTGRIQSEPVGLTVLSPALAQRSGGRTLHHTRKISVPRSVQGVTSTRSI
mgnify:CR=1 FL=1